MKRFLALLDRWFQSTPPALRGRTAAAASIDSRSQGWGKAALGAGHQNPAPATTPTPLAGAGQTPEEDARPGTRASSGPPACETDLFWEPAEENAFEFTNSRMAELLLRWGWDA